MSSYFSSEGLPKRARSCYIGQKAGKCLCVSMSLVPNNSLLLWDLNFTVGYKSLFPLDVTKLLTKVAHRLCIFKQLLKTLKIPLFSIPWYHTKHSKFEELVRKCILHKVLALYITSEGLNGSFGFI